MDSKQKIYNKDEIVPEDGIYVCSPCGFKTEFKKGEKFTECTSCLSGTSDGDPEYANGSGLWEKAENNQE